MLASQRALRRLKEENKELSDRIRYLKMYSDDSLMEHKVARLRNKQERTLAANSRITQKLELVPARADGAIKDLADLQVEHDALLLSVSRLLNKEVNLTKIIEENTKLKANLSHCNDRMNHYRWHRDRLLNLQPVIPDDLKQRSRDLYNIISELKTKADSIVGRIR